MIDIKNLNFSYRKGHKIFDDMTISIERGGICGLLGKNGVGKTTLLHLISGLLKPSVEDSIIVAGKIPFSRGVDFLQSVFLLPEDFAMPRVTARKFAEMYSPFYPKFSWELFTELLAEFEVNIEDKLHTMSYGQRKKAYISFAVACNTDLLLLDEPTNGLDIPSKNAFRRAMARFMDDSRTIIISTHQVRDLEEILDRVIILDNEQVLLNASVGEITHRLRFEVVEDGDDVLYSEQSIRGKIGVTENKGDEETSLDMELLFNAVSENKTRVKEIFNK